MHPGKPVSCLQLIGPYLFYHTSPQFTRKEASGYLPKEGSFFRCFTLRDGGGSRNCENLLAAVKEAAAEKGIEAEIEYITDLARIMEYGIMSTPALMIDNRIVSMGRVLKAKDVLKYL